jgi:hypothetical protein
MTFSTYLSPGVALQGGGSGGGGGAASAPLTGTGAIITTSQPLIDVSQTWNSSGTTFTGAKINVTNTASAAASLLLDLQVGTTSLFSVGKAGNVKAPSGSAAAPSYAMDTTGMYSRAAFARVNFSVGGTDTGIEIGPVTLALQNTASLVWTAGLLPSSSPDTYITRKAERNLQLGAADAATALAQTLSVQSVVAGTTSNGAGADFKINGSQSTGSGIGGSIIFQTAAANSGGGATVQNTLATAMVIDSVKTVRLGTGYTVATLPAAGTAGRRTYVTDALAPVYLGTLTGGGAVVCPVFDNGTAWVSA